MHFKSCSLIAAASLFPVALFGLGIRLPDQDAVATARGEAFVATADNPSAIYYNPAGIAFLTGQNARIGIYAIDLWDTFSGSGVHKETKSDLQAVPHIYYTYTPEKCPVSAGFGIYAPYGLGLEWPDNTPFRNLAKEGRIQYLTFNPVVAWKIHDTLSISAGPGAWAGAGAGPGLGWRTSMSAISSAIGAPTAAQSGSASSRARLSASRKAPSRFSSRREGSPVRQSRGRSAGLPSAVR